MGKKLSPERKARARKPRRDPHKSLRARSRVRAVRGGAVLALVVAAGLLLLADRAASAASPAGEVVGVRGQCFDLSGGGRTALTLGAAVAVGDTVEVPAGARLKLRMSDGSILSLASGSAVTIREYALGPSGRRRNALLSLGLGLLRALVTTGSPGRFAVETAVGVAAVRSTDWFVEVQPGAARVGVLRGAVTLTSRATGRSVTIPAHWGGRLEAGLDPTPPRLWSPAEFDAVIARTNLN